MANTRTVAAGGGADHTTIGAALSWFQSNHDFDTDGIGTIEVTDTSAYDESITISGISGTPSITAYLKITVTSGNRHAGVAGTGHARIAYSGANTAAIQVSTDFTMVEYLEIERTNPGGSDEGIRQTSGTNDCLYSRLIIHTDSASTDTDGVYIGNWAATYSIDNCILYGWNRGGIHCQNFSGASAQTVNIDYCTVYECGNGGADEGGIVAFANNSGSGVTINVYNTAALDSVNGQDFFDRQVTGITTWTGTNNACSDTTLSSAGVNLTTGAQESLTTADTTQATGDFFVVNDLTAGSEDLLLLDDAAGNKAYGNAVDRVGSEPDSRQDFSIDIAGNPRSTTSPAPDIGASEYTDAGIAITESTVNTNYATDDPTVTLTGTVSITESVVNTNYTSLDPVIDLTGIVSITESLVNTNYTSLDPAIDLTGVVDITESLVNTNYTSLNPTITLTSGILVTESTVNTNYAALDPAITLTGTVSVTESLVNTNYVTLDPAIDLTGTVSVTESLVNTNYTALDATIELTPAIQIIEQLVNTNYTSLDPTVELIAGLKITEQTVGAQYQAKDPSILLTPPPIPISSTVCFPGVIEELIYNGIEVSVTFNGTQQDVEFNGISADIEFNGTIQTTCNNGNIQTNC
jgi:hypothetical protein